MCVLAIVRQITPKVGVVRSRDLILQYDVKVGNKTALAALTNLGHVNPFLLLGPPHHLTIQWVREITSPDSKLPDQSEVHIRSGTPAEKTRSHSIRTLFTQQCRCRCCSKTSTIRGVSYSPPCKIVDLFGPLMRVLSYRGRFDPWAN